MESWFIRLSDDLWISISILVNNMFQNIVFFVQQKKQTHMGLEKLQDEWMMTKLSFLLNFVSLKLSFIKPADRLRSSCLLISFRSADVRPSWSGCAVSCRKLSPASGSCAATSHTCRRSWRSSGVSWRKISDGQENNLNVSWEWVWMHKNGFKFSVNMFVI